MKISKRTREQAALICAIAASTNWEQCGGWDGIRVHANDERATNLATLAWLSVGRSFSLGERWAEAEALLRTGWTP